MASLSLFHLLRRLPLPPSTLNPSTTLVSRPYLPLNSLFSSTYFTRLELVWAVKEAPRECQQCTIEACNLQNLLINLRYCLDQGRTGDPWFTAVRALNIENGPLDQYKQALEQLRSGVEIKDGVQEIKRRLLWKFSTEEVESILARMERLKRLVNIALEMERDDAEANSKDEYGRTPLSPAAVGGHEAVVRLLAEPDDVHPDSEDKDGRTQLLLVAEFVPAQSVIPAQSDCSVQPCTARKAEWWVGS